jgi:hypothetical protein
MVFLVYFFIILYYPVEESYFLVLFVFFFRVFVKVCSVPFLGCVWFSGLAEDQCGDIPYHG